ncbi:MAG: hypothetical protein WC436_01165 [Candidatus Babeliales bacterium]
MYFLKILKNSFVAIFLFTCGYNLQAEIPEETISIRFDLINPLIFIDEIMTNEVTTSYITLNINKEEKLKTVEQIIKEKLAKEYNLDIPQVNIFNTKKGLLLLDPIDWEEERTFNLNIWLLGCRRINTPNSQIKTTEQIEVEQIEQEVDQIEPQISITFEYLNPTMLICKKIPSNINIDDYITIDINHGESIESVGQRITKELENKHNIIIPEISIVNFTNTEVLQDPADWETLKTCKLDIIIDRNQLLEVN